MTQPGDREWQLLLDCCVLGDEELAERFGRAVAAPGFSVPHFLAAARYHKLHLVAGRLLSDRKHPRLHGDARELAQRLFPEHHRLHMHRADLMTAAAVEITDRLAGTAPVAVTKGVALQHAVYGDDGSRFYGDVDIMVRERDTRVVADVLDGLGFAVGAYDERRGRVVPLRAGLRMATALSRDHLPKRVRLTGDRAVPVVELDTAFSLTWGDAPWQVPVDDALAATAGIDTPQGTISTLLPPYHFLFVVLHLFREAWFEHTLNRILSPSKSVRLGQFRDVVVTWRWLGPGERDRVRDLIARHHLGDPVGWVVTHTDRVLGTSVRSEVGLPEPEEDWLSSAAAAGGARDAAGDGTSRWSGTMTTRLRDRGIQLAAAAAADRRVRLGVSVAPPEVRDIPAFAEWAERIGVDTLSFGEGRLRRDAVVPMTLAAARTSRVTIASGVIPVRTRNVSLLATTFKTLHQLAPGRIRLGVGAWWEPIASRVGLRTESPLLAMREVLAVLRQLFAGGEATLDGRYVQVDRIRFDAPEDDSGRAYDIPLLVGAVGDRMLALAGELADGALLDFFVPPAYTARARRLFADGIRRAGRAVDPFLTPQLIACAVDDRDPAAAVGQCRLVLARYLAQQPHIGAASGADPELVSRLRATVGWPATTAQIEEAARLVPLDLVRGVAACGSTDDVLATIQRYLDAGCGEPVLVPFGDRIRTVEAIVARRAELRAGAC